MSDNNAWRWILIDLGGNPHVFDSDPTPDMLGDLFRLHDPEHGKLRAENVELRKALEDCVNYGHLPEGLEEKATTLLNRSAP